VSSTLNLGIYIWRRH